MKVLFGKSKYECWTWWRIGWGDDFQPEGSEFDSRSTRRARRDLGQVFYLQFTVRFGVKLRYNIRAVVGSSSE